MDVGPHNGTWARSIVLEKSGHEIGALQPPSAVYLGTLADGIFRSADQGTTWVPFDEGLPDLEITALAVAQKEIPLGAPEIAYETALYAGTQTRGLFSYLTEWTQVAGGLSGSQVFAIAAASTDIVYVATESGLFKTGDGGITWSSASSGLPMDQVTALAVNPQSPQTVLAGVGSQVFKSSDGAESWIPVLSLPGLAVTSIGIALTNPSAILVGAGPNGPVPAVPILPGQVFRSTDGGKTWTNLTDPLRGLPGVLVFSFAFDAVTPTVYAGTWGEGVFKSADMGDTWLSLNSGLTDDFVSALAFDSSADQPSLYAGTAPSGYLSGGPVFNIAATLSPPNPRAHRTPRSVPFRDPR